MSSGLIFTGLLQDFKGSISSDSFQYDYLAIGVLYAKISRLGNSCIFKIELKLLHEFYLK
ncbi:hypothetical protein NMS_1024 [Nonlabens marinus S1-08]|uniref:Uncharacterized protein n=1 Tax=Nonlabens marinus S1-08 TaxID=1454201 RepID=W8VV04_9FLAO|nr:hypothetical protein NMS_1024 [Nonlabens marinus S1-08]